MAEGSGVKTKVASGAAPRRAARAGYAACAWAFLFAAAHFYWALGGCAGFPVEACEAGLSNAWFLAYDLVAGVLCVLGAVIALALARPWDRMIRRRTLLVLAWAGGAVLLLRGGVGLVQDVLIVTGPGNGWSPTMLYDPWFLVGGVLFCAAAWHHRRGSAGGKRASFLPLQ
jgi:hypothetical protein